jgi:hypothetical protein
VDFADLVEPDLVEPDLVEPDLVVPDLADPDLAEPDLAALDLADPDFADPAFADPDLGKTDLDNTDVARDHSFHCIANAESGVRQPYYACGVNGFNIPVTLSASLLPAAVRVPKSGRRQIELHSRQERPGRRALIGELASLVLGKTVIG